jgi:hypothetical protein
MVEMNSSFYGTTNSLTLNSIGHVLEQVIGVVSSVVQAAFNYSIYKFKVVLVLVIASCSIVCVHIISQANSVFDFIN